MKTKRFKAKFTIKKGDRVVVITGDDKNLTTPKTVLSVLYDKAKILVEGVNVQKRHMKPTAQKTQGEIVNKEAPISISNVLLWDAKTKKGVKVKRVRENNKVTRVSKKSGEVI